jgi:hypothetical protein
VLNEVLRIGLGVLTFVNLCKEHIEISKHCLLIVDASFFCGVPFKRFGLNRSSPQSYPLKLATSLQ